MYDYLPGGLGGALFWDIGWLLGVEPIGLFIVAFGEVGVGVGDDALNLKSKLIW